VIANKGWMTATAARCGASALDPAGVDRLISQAIQSATDQLVAREMRTDMKIEAVTATLFPEQDLYTVTVIASGVKL
jgi:hypothetical protein